MTKRVRIASMSPINGVPWHDGQVLNASSWWAWDGWTEDPDGSRIMRRRIMHWKMTMLFFEARNGVWEAVPVSIGWGSASDQQGINKILYGTYIHYRRDERGGGPRYVNLQGATA